MELLSLMSVVLNFRHCIHFFLFAIPILISCNNLIAFSDSFSHTCEIDLS